MEVVGGVGGGEAVTAADAVDDAEAEAAAAAAAAAAVELETVSLAELTAILVRLGWVDAEARAREILEGERRGGRGGLAEAEAEGG